jgi:GNAT superfamily N-acetyltransferase
MKHSIRLERLSEQNFADFESITRNESGGGCYCSFWHQKWSSRSDWDQQCKDAPEKNRATVLEKVRAGFHVGVLAYKDSKLAAWVSVGPVIDFYWSWRRVGALKEDANKTAGILCIAIVPEFRGQHLQQDLLEALKEYGSTQGWKSIEGYPFDRSAHEKHGEHVRWPGLPKAFEHAGYQRVESHWLNNAEAERSIFKWDL